MAYADEQRSHRIVFRLFARVFCPVAVRPYTCLSSGSALRAERGQRRERGGRFFLYLFVSVLFQIQIFQLFSVESYST